MLYFSGEPSIFPNITGIKSLYNRGRKLIQLFAGEPSFGAGEAISVNLSTGEATRAHLTVEL